jgi:hypothetical protein
VGESVRQSYTENGEIQIGQSDKSAILDGRAAEVMSASEEVGRIPADGRTTTTVRRFGMAE